MTVSSMHFVRAAAGARKSALIPLALVFPFPSHSLSQQSPPTALDEVIVTARKIEEDARKVPMSLQVLDSAYLADSDRASLYELQFSIPGLVLNNLGMLGAGFSLRGVSDQSGTAGVVAPHLDGVYLGSAELAITRMYDLERVEVLKGPQGTLYGRNSIGGSINVITRAPTEAWSAGVEAAFGSFSTLRAEGHVNMPLEGAGLRVAFIASEGNGYIRNSVDARRFAANDYWGVRASLRLQPGPDTRIDLVAQHMEDRGGTGELWSPNPAFLPDPRDIRLTTVTLDDPHLHVENSVVSANVMHELGFATLHSITGLARNRVSDLDDCAGLPQLAGCVRSGGESFSQLSEELQLRLRSDRAEGVLGLYYYDDDSDSSFYQLVPPNTAPTIDDVDTASETTIAVFGQGTLRLGARWSATAGLRLSHEELQFTTIERGMVGSAPPLVGRSSATNDSWRVDVSYAARDDLQLYAGISTGYRSAAIQLIDDEPANVAPENLLAYEAGLKSRWLDRRLTVDAAAFLYDYKDMQVLTQELVGNDVISYLANAAQAQLYGIDASATMQLGERIVASAAVVWMPKREFVEYVNSVSGDVLSGNKLERAPETSATLAVDYEHALRSGASLLARIEYAYRSGYYYTEDNIPFFSQDAFGLLNAMLKLESADGRWYGFASGRNITEEDYFYQVFIQSSPGLPATWEIGAGCRF